MPRRTGACLVFASPNRISVPYPHDLFQFKPRSSAIVELGRSGVRVVGQVLRDLQCSTVCEELCDAGRTERVVAKGRRNPCFEESPLHHSQRVASRHRRARESHPVLFDRREEGLALTTAAGRNPSIDVLDHLRVCGNVALNAALFSEPEHLRSPEVNEVVRRECQSRRDAGQGIGHDGDQRPIAQVNEASLVEALKEHAHLLCGKSGCLTSLDADALCGHLTRGVKGEGSRLHHVREEFAQGAELSLDRRRRIPVCRKLLPERRDPERSDLVKIDASILAPGRELFGVPKIRVASVGVGDLGPEVIRDRLSGRFAAGHV